MNSSIHAIASTLLLAVVLASCEAMPVQNTAVQTYQGTGDVVEYHANGKVSRKASFVDGHLVSSVSFYTSGVMESTENYSEDQLKTATYYYKSGDIKATVGL